LFSDFFNVDDPINLSLFYTLFSNSKENSFFLLNKNSKKYWEKNYSVLYFIDFQVEIRILDPTENEKLQFSFFPRVISHIFVTSFSFLFFPYHNSFESFEACLKIHFMQKYGNLLECQESSVFSWISKSTLPKTYSDPVFRISMTRKPHSHISYLIDRKLSVWAAIFQIWFAFTQK